MRVSRRISITRNPRRKEEEEGFGSLVQSFMVGQRPNKYRLLVPPADRQTLQEGRLPEPSLQQAEDEAELFNDAKHEEDNNGPQ